MSIVDRTALKLLYKSRSPAGTTQHAADEATCKGCDYNIRCKRDEVSFGINLEKCLKQVTRD